MNYIEKDFSNLIINPLGKQNLCEQYPNFLEIMPNGDGKAYDKALRYIILCYDPSSRLVKMEKDLNRRKVVAAELAGFNIKDDEGLESLYSFSDENVLDLLIGYLRHFCKNEEWAAIVAHKESYWENIKLILKPIGQSSDTRDKEVLESVQKKALIKEQLQEDLKNIPAMEKRFWGDDSAVENKAKGRITAEGVANSKVKSR